MLPEPALTLTLPSLHDGLTLDCRIYHPLSLAANPRAPTWQRHAAVVSHPYAPMGGSYDDPIVETVAATLLRKGFLVGTFNFRGAGNSAGRTSWTAKAECEDYATIAGFMVHYIHFLDPFSQPPPDRSPYQSLDIFDTTPASSEPKPKVEPYHPVLLFGGYSYGAMITTSLPPLDSIIEPFINPNPDSDAYQVRLRAQHLAEQQNLVLGSARAAMVERGASRSSSKRGVRIGGDESGSPRKSHDSHRRSFSIDAEDKIRRSIGEFIVKASRGRHGQRFLSPDWKGPNGPEAPASEPLTIIPHLIIPTPAYLLISPLRGLANHLVTCSLVPSALVRTRQPEDAAAEEKLVRHPTLAVFGDNDVFVSAAKLKAWAKRLEGRQMSMFHGEEIATAGHFWVEVGVLDRMRELVAKFCDMLIG